MSSPKSPSGYDLRMVTTAELTEQVPIEVPPNAQNVRYLQTKRAKLGQKLHPRDLRFETDEQ